MQSGVCYSRKKALVTLNSLGGVSGGERLAIDVNHGLLSEIERLFVIMFFHLLSKCLK